MYWVDFDDGVTPPARYTSWYFAPLPANRQIPSEFQPARRPKSLPPLDYPPQGSMQAQGQPQGQPQAQTKPQLQTQAPKPAPAPTPAPTPISAYQSQPPSIPFFTHTPTPRASLSPKTVDPRIAGTRLAYHLHQIANRYSNGINPDIERLAKLALAGPTAQYEADEPDVYAKLGHELERFGDLDWLTAYRWDKIKRGLVVDQAVDRAIKNPALNDFIGKNVIRGSKHQFLRRLATLAQKRRDQMNESEYKTWTHPLSQHVWNHIREAAEPALQEATSSVGMRGKQLGSERKRILSQSILRSVFRAEDRDLMSKSKITPTQAATQNITRKGGEGRVDDWQTIFNMRPGFASDPRIGAWMGPGRVGGEMNPFEVIDASKRDNRNAERYQRVKRKYARDPEVEQHLQQAIYDDPVNEHVHKMNYADWLEENGLPATAKILRDSVTTPMSEQTRMPHDGSYQLRWWKYAGSHENGPLGVGVSVATSRTRKNPVRLIAAINLHRKSPNGRFKHMSHFSTSDTELLKSFLAEHGVDDDHLNSIIEESQNKKQYNRQVNNQRSNRPRAPELRRGDSPPSRKAAGEAGQFGEPHANISAQSHTYTPSNSQSWLDPQGNFHPLGLQTHADWAAAKGVDIHDLFKRGWHRIIYSGPTLYAHNDAGILPNNRQRRELIDHAIMSGGKFRNLTFDAGDSENPNDGRVLWRHEGEGQHEREQFKRINPIRRYSAVHPMEVHPDFQVNGIAPRIGHALMQIAAYERHAGASSLAEQVLKTGDTSLLPMIGDELMEAGHPLAGKFQWANVPRGIAIDRAMRDLLHNTRILRYDPNDAIPTRKVGPQSAGWTLADWKEGSGKMSRRRALNEVRKSVPDANIHELYHSLLRLYDHDELRLTHRHKLSGEKMTTNPFAKKLAEQTDVFADRKQHWFDLNNHNLKLLGSQELPVGTSVMQYPSISGQQPIKPRRHPR